MKRRRRRRTAGWARASALTSVVVVSSFVVGAGIATLQSSRPEPAEDDRGIPGLAVAAEGSRFGYERSQFPHWSDDDGDRCNAREEVLIAESVVPAQVDPYGCVVVAGEWHSAYDGLVLEDPAELDVDHVVALGEAWDSGASSWTPEQRKAFANDLDNDISLRAVSATSNRSKGDKDPAEWLPTVAGFRCTYAREWVAVKVTWGLTADPAEVRALRGVLKGCQ